jgi:hypothetical protein
MHCLVAVWFQLVAARLGHFIHHFIAALSEDVQSLLSLMVNYLLGFFSCFIAILGFGVNFVPVKKYDTGDGLFYQFVMCSATLFIGIIVQLIRNTAFQPLAMLGGVLWSLGNITAIPIIQLVGFGLGSLLWNAANLIFGWAVGTSLTVQLHAAILFSWLKQILTVLLEIVCRILWLLGSQQTNRHSASIQYCRGPLILTINDNHVLRAEQSAQQY